MPHSQQLQSCSGFGRTHDSRGIRRAWRKASLRVIGAAIALESVRETGSALVHPSH